MDGTDTKQDVKTSATNQETSNNTPQTFTQEQVNAMVKKAAEDALSAAGRDAKTLEARKSEQERREQELKNWESKRAKDEEARELAELEAVKDKPEELPIVQRKQKLAADIKAFNLERDQAKPILDAIKTLGINDAEKLVERIRKAEVAEFEVTIFDVASKHNVDANVLKDKAGKLKLKEAVDIEELAASLPKKTVVPSPDSGKTLGGSDSSKLSPEEKYRLGREKEQKK